MTNYFKKESFNSPSTYKITEEQLTRLAYLEAQEAKRQEQIVQKDKDDLLRIDKTQKELIEKIEDMEIRLRRVCSQVFPYE